MENASREAGDCHKNVDGGNMSERLNELESRVEKQQKQLTDQLQAINKHREGDDVLDTDDTAEELSDTNSDRSTSRLVAESE